MRKKFIKITENLDNYVVFADILGGTPCNVVSALILEGKNIDLYTGMNMPMVIEFINDLDSDSSSDYTEAGNESIVKVNDLLNECDDDEDE